MSAFDVHAPGVLALDEALVLLQEILKADLVFLAMGFTGVPQDHPIVAQLKLAQTPRTALISDPARNICCVGDCASGASLVVRALASGKNIPFD